MVSSSPWSAARGFVFRAEFGEFGVGFGGRVGGSLGLRVEGV